MFFFGGGWMTMLYYIPLYFQSVKGTDAVGSGVRMLAMIIPMTIAVVSQGFALMKIGIVPLFWTVGSALAAVGSGLLYTMNEGTTTGEWIGFQIIIGFVAGATFQVAITNAQVQSSNEDMSQVTAIVNCESSSSC
jgi:MFS transporter, DHA2 family, glioxin efflux transporter